MKYSLKISLRKFLAYGFILGILLLAILAFIEIISRKSRADQNLAEYIKIGDNMPKVIFIGSSRVQASVDPGMLKQHTPQYNFYNMGLSGSSILYNCRLAEKIIPSIPSGSFIFVELSDFRLSPSGYFYYFNTYRDLYRITKKRFALGIGFKELESVFFSLINISPQIKANLSSSKAFMKEIGFSRWKTTYTGSENTFINRSDMDKSGEQLSTLQSKYLAILNELIAEGKKNGVKVIFILPLNIKVADQKKELLPIFHAIPEANKWVYSADFIRSISEKKYQGDIIHLNETGAKLYTSELAGVIRRLSE